MTTAVVHAQSGSYPSGSIQTQHNPKWYCIRSTLYCGVRTCKSIVLRPGERSDLCFLGWAAAVLTAYWFVDLNASVHRYMVFAGSNLPIALYLALLSIL